MDNLDKSIQYVKGVGPKRAKRLKKLDIETVEDMLYYFPRSYEDRRKIDKINNCKVGEKITLKVTVCSPPRVLKTRRRLTITKVPVKDETGFAVLVWFNQNYISNQLKVGDALRVNGKVKINKNKIEIHNVTYEKGNRDNKIGRIIPIYPLTEKVNNNEIMKIVNRVIEDYLVDVKEVLPKDILERWNIEPLKNALRNIHFPQDKEKYNMARKRLVFEELLLLQLGLFAIKRNNNSDVKGIKFHKNKEIENLINNLPFKLTNAQKRVINEISSDMESYKHMNRLIQGDVGSGKTIVAVLAMFKAYKSGFQSVMMAPTEILANQHYESITNVLKDYKVNCKLLIGSLTSKKKKEILDSLKKGDVDIIVGTHAIIQDNVEFKNLGLAITDEQHRFGVRQRAVLSLKGQNPDILVMTATPIPRTLALILYGDLDISVIDELPPGRKKIETYAVGNNMKARVYDFIKKQIEEGRQTYIVCPLVEESESMNVQSAVELYENLKEGYFKEYRLGLLHGKMKPIEKDSVMNKFKHGEIDILISTTVIEVGVNVSNANIMVIKNAERFGLAQLHQLRGRVGRGEYKSYCILINESKTKISTERMKIMETTNDGFVISEKDLQIRGPGEFFGTRQHGLPDLKIANIFTDMKILKQVQKEALKILEEDPNLESDKYKGIKQNIVKMFKRKVDEITFN